MYADATKATADSSHVLDRWIVNRLNQVIQETTAGYKNYELDKATRPITEFIDDLSVWYLRRSRDRLKGEDAVDKEKALATLRYTLRTLALVMAPVMPFYAEYLWQAVKQDVDAESVHLAAWPKAGDIDLDNLKAMEETREVVTAALEARTKAGIKVRQPLGSLMTNRALTPEYTNIIADEVNVRVASTDGTDVAVLDLTLTDELLAEGAVRELMRAVQGRRKTEGLAPSDEIVLTVQSATVGRQAIETHQTLLSNTVGAREVVFADTDGEVVATEVDQFVFTIKKV